MKITLSTRAQRDLAEIREYLLKENPAAADSVRLAIAAAIDLLGKRPEIGLRTQGTETRSKLVAGYPYRIHYRVRVGLLEIIHVRHTARRPWRGG